MLEICPFYLFFSNLPSGNGETQSRSQEDGDGRSQLHRVATSRRVLGDLVAQVAHDVVAESPEAEAEAEAADGLDPRWGIGLGGRDAADPGLVLGGEGTDGARDIVGAVGDRHDHGGADLGSGLQLLDLVVVLWCALVHLVEAARLVADDVAGHAVHEDELDGDEDALWMSPRELVDGSKILGPLFIGAVFRSLVNVCGGCNLGTGDSTIVQVLLFDIWVGGVARFGLFSQEIGSVVIWNYLAVFAAWEVELLIILPEERSHWQMPDANATTLLDEFSVVVGDEENSREDHQPHRIKRPE